MVDIPTFERAKQRGKRPVQGPGHTIDFGDHERLTTSEVLEELGISYDCLAARRRQSKFPRPVVAGHNGKTAMYDRDAVDWWCMKQGLRVKPRVKSL